MSYYTVKDIDVDLYKYKETQFGFDHKINYQVFTQYIDENYFEIIVRRLDKNEGFQENINVFFHCKTNDFTQIVNLGASPNNNELCHIVRTDFPIYPSTTLSTRLPHLILPDFPESKGISLQEFNNKFHSEMDILPDSLYAVGLLNGVVYMHNEKFCNYYCIIHQIKHIIQVAILNKYTNFYFILCQYDGYLTDEYYNENRVNPKKISNASDTFEETEYPIYHKKKYILGQSHHINLPYSLDAIDKHYFYHNYYNSFRSYHNGVPFHKKSNMLVYAGQRNGSKYNFISRKDIDIMQRDYFKNEFVPQNKDFIVCDGWIERQDMALKWKYILDIDGYGATWDATAWKLNSGSVIFKTKSKWRQWFHDEYLPNVHYIEVADDFGDLREKYEWALTHEEECLGMIENSKQLFQKVYCFHNVVAHTKRVLDILIE